MVGNTFNSWLIDCTGIEAQVMPDNSITYRYCTVSLHKDNLTITRKGDFKNPASIQKDPDKTNPVAIILSGKGILTKKTTMIETVTTDVLIKLFPAVKAERFYIQNFKSGEYSYISLIRREQADEIVTSFNKAGFKVLTLSLGPFISSHILQQLNLYGDEIIFDGHCISLKDKYWENYQYRPEESARFPVKIEIEAIPETNILSYSAAFQLILYKRLNFIGLSTEMTTNALSEFDEQRKFRKRTVFILSISFIALMLNFFLYNYFNSLNMVLVQEASHNTAALSNTKMLEQELKQKELLLREIGWNKGLRYSFILDQIGHSVPPTITLNAVDVNNKTDLLTKASLPSDSGAGKIKISGETTEMNSLNNWIYSLRDKNWIKEITLASFKPAQEIGKQTFTIIVSY